MAPKTPANESETAVQVTKSALILKDEGNAHFAKLRFDNAVACYTEALTLVKDDDESLGAVLLSNRSSCYYEMGKYESAAVDAKACIAILQELEDPSSKTSLLCKNLWRLARALHYGDDESFHCGEEDDGSRAADIRPILQQIANLSEPSFSLDQLSYYDEDDALPKARTTFESTPLRPCFQNPYHEYYKFGHDEAASVLVSHNIVDSQSIRLQDLNDEELSSLSFLFGGVGDGRHVMATLLDAHQQYLSLPPVRQNTFRLRMTLNDINAQLLAKDALVLVLACEMGRLAKDMNEAQTRREPFLLGVVIMYATLGHAMPPVVHEKMMDCIRSWFINSSRDKFLKAFPWLHISPYTWDSIIVNMTAWVDPSGEQGYSPKLPSVSAKLSKLNPVERSTDSLLSQLSSMGVSSEAMAEMDTKLNAQKQEREQMVEAARTIELTPDLMEAAKAQLGEDVTEEEAREFIVDHLAQVSDDELFGGPVIDPWDKLFLETTHALRPPKGPVMELNEESEVVRQAVESHEDASEAISSYTPTIHQNWKVNPVQTDPFYSTFVDGHGAVDEYNPVKDFPRMFMNDSVLSYMTEPPLTLAESKENPDGFVKDHTLARTTIRFYWHVGNALNDLSDKVSLEIDLGSIIAWGMKIARMIACRHASFTAFLFQTYPIMQGCCPSFV